ncbi:MAG: hypothetical protein COV44_04510 [Deltaproteobacteria bacterium CG11_big_fil_rev_8_21_14_0_20_45_16]|nr:MAG: hypothetical protein COV44_04510 [Deltaproteobacteria bacterium CG11_big_fil_rev_8_21_14_0_20_45_16]
MSEQARKQSDPSETAVEFSADSKRRFDEILKRYDSKRSALLPVLHLAQNEFGSVHDRVVEYVAKIMDLSPAQVLEVVTFYHMYHRKPQGENHLQFCATISCWMNGSHQLYKSTCSRLGIKDGEVTPDGKFSVQRVECLGSCGSAPVVQVNETYYENLTPEKLNRLINSCKEGNPQRP